MKSLEFVVGFFEVEVKVGVLKGVSTHVMGETKGALAERCLAEVDCVSKLEWKER